MTLCGYLVMTIGQRDHYSTTLIPTAIGTIPNNALAQLLFVILTVFELLVDNKICGRHSAELFSNLRKSCGTVSFLSDGPTHSLRHTACMI